MSTVSPEKAADCFAAVRHPTIVQEGHKARGTKIKC